MKRSLRIWEILTLEAISIPNESSIFTGTCYKHLSFNIIRTYTLAVMNPGDRMIEKKCI